MKKALILLGVTMFAHFAAAAADYVVIAPKNHVGLWKWYVGERAKTHGAVTFAVKNAAEIYATYPYGEGRECRNAAESIHRYIRETAKTGTKYFVLGGVWFDAQNPDEAGNLATGEKIDVDSAIPGIRAYPTVSRKEDGFFTNYPSDLFYACHYLGPESSAAYPWDPNGDGVYCSSGELRRAEYLTPAVVVSRMDFVPGAWKDADGRRLNYAGLVTNYVAKLRRGEAKDFPGRGRYVANVNFLLDFGKDGYPDVKNIMQTRLDAIGGYRPARELYMAAVKSDLSNVGELNAKTLAGDWEVALPFGHGIPDTCAYIDERAFIGQTGLIRFFAANIPCFTGTVTTFSSESGLLSAIAQTMLSNPKGGTLVSINNTFMGQSTPTALHARYCGISDELLDYTLDAYVRDGKTAGEAWKTAISTYVGIIYGANQAAEIKKRDCDVEKDLPYIQSAIVEEMLFGDPLVKLAYRKAPKVLVK